MNEPFFGGALGAVLAGDETALAGGGGAGRLGGIAGDLRPLEGANDDLDSEVPSCFTATADGLSVDGLETRLGLEVEFAVAVAGRSGRRTAFAFVVGRGVPFDAPSVVRGVFAMTGERRSSVALRFGAGLALSPVIEARRSPIGILVTMMRKSAAAT